MMASGGRRSVRLHRVEFKKLFVTKKREELCSDGEKDNVTSLIKILWSTALERKQREEIKPTRNDYLPPGTFAKVLWTNYN
jgi:hypothetical protein